MAELILSNWIGLGPLTLKVNKLLHREPSFGAGGRWGHGGREGGREAPELLRLEQQSMAGAAKDCHVPRSTLLPLLTDQLLFIFHDLAQHLTLPVARIPAARCENQDRLPSMDLLIGIVVFTLLSFGLCEAAGRIVTSHLTVDNGGRWGDWGPPEFCRSGHANGFSIKVLPYQGWLVGQDDTGLEGVRLHCADGSRAESSSGERGQWSDVQTCLKGSLTSFSLRVSGNQGPGDDTAANNIKFKCADDNVLTGVGPEWGEFGGWSPDCVHGYICGIQTRVEPDRGKGDDTGLNDVKFFCCI